MGTIANVNDATTTIVMNGDCIITANFVQGKKIRDWYALDAIRDNLGGSYLLMNDLDSTTAGYEELAAATANEGKGWQPIGTFTGSFDGHGYEIRDLFIDRPDESGVGLFGGVDMGAVVEDIGVVNATVTGKDNVGSLVGWNEEGTVSDSYYMGSVTGVSWVGGLVGRNKAIVNNSSWDTETSGQVTSEGWTGKTTMEMKNIATFSGADWDIITIANPGTRKPSHIWNIINGVTYPFLNWES